MTVLILLTALLATALLWRSPSARAEESPVSVTLDGTLLPTDGQIIHGRTLVPFRSIFEALGAGVDWDSETRKVTAARGRDSLALTIGSQVVEWRRSIIKVDVAPVIVDGRTLVPLRFIAQALGLHVRWDGATRTVHLETSPDDPRLAQGIQLVHKFSCMICHTINGAGGNIGPNLNGVVDRYGEEWLHDWLRDPQAVREGSRMPNFQFSDAEIEAVVEYLKSLN